LVDLGLEWLNREGSGVFEPETVSVPAVASEGHERLTS
jgi:hypothetical protein